MFHFSMEAQVSKKAFEVKGISLAHYFKGKKERKEERIRIRKQGKNMNISYLVYWKISISSSFLPLLEAGAQSPKRSLWAECISFE